MTFEDFGLNRQLLNAIETAGYTIPTEIQQEAIPRVLAGQDVLGIAQTGTGKTAAYLLPVLYKIKYAQGVAPRCLILAPTRELVMQIGEVTKQLSQFTDLRSVCLYGGLGPKTQIEALQAGVDIIVSTPGRFMDLYLRGEIPTKLIKTLVLDEADKMMDMGFMPQIRQVLEVIPTKKQKLLFSATFSERVERLSHEYLEFPTRIEITRQATAASTIEQRVFAVPNLRTKLNLLAHLLATPEAQKSMVFVRSKDIADQVTAFLGRKIFHEAEVKVIHANKGQNTRINVMNLFRENLLRVLVATDVAARGIDIEEVTHVINFDVPLMYEDYVHRIGRTGRATRSGVAVTFVTPAEELHFGRIEELIRQVLPREALPKEVDVPETPFIERQEQLRELDLQRRRADPTFQGAFHEKKKPKKKPLPPKTGRPSPKNQKKR